jgi:hypothetical protein
MACGALSLYLSSEEQPSSFDGALQSQDDHWTNYDYSNIDYNEHESCTIAAGVAVEALANSPPGMVGLLAAEVAGPLVGIALETTREMLESSEAAREVAKEVAQDLCNVVFSMAEAPPSKPSSHPPPHIDRP